MALLARTLGLSAIALGIAACSGDDDRVDANGEYDANSGINVSRFIGITKNSPDEFAVKTTKPLELPKNFAALPAPTPGARSRLDTDPIADARTILLGAAETQPEKAPVSAAESALLASARTEEVDPNIREVLAQEQAALEASQPTYALENVFPSIRRDVNADDALQASDERQRLSEVLPTREFGGTPTPTPTPAPTLPIAKLPPPVFPPVAPPAVPTTAATSAATAPAPTVAAQPTGVIDSVLSVLPEPAIPSTDGVFGK